MGVLPPLYCVIVAGQLSSILLQWLVQFMSVLDVKETEGKTNRRIFKCVSLNSPEAYVVLHTQVNFKGYKEINSAITINLILLRKKKICNYSKCHFADETLLSDLIIKIFFLDFGFSQNDAVNLIYLIDTENR